MKRKIIITFITIISIMCIIVFTMIKILEKEEGNNMDENIIKEIQDPLNPEADTIKEEYKIEKERNATRFFTVQECIQTYINYINNKNSEALIDILNPEYLEEKNITKDNVLDNVNVYNRGSTFIAKEIEILKGDKIFQYRVYGYVENENEEQSAYFIVNTDKINLTFVIEPCKDKEYTQLNQIPLEKINIEKYEKNENNNFTYKDITREEICRIYQRYYTELEKVKIEEAYEILDDDYRKERFPDIEDFKTYVEENIEAIEQATMASYSVNQGNDSTKYVIKDSYNNQYIIEEESIMNFKIKLDAYTIPDASYSESYAKLPDSEKASANIGIFIQMINTKDYKHAYDKLDEGFKKNYFQSLEQFKEYIKNNLYNYNSYTINNYKNEGNVEIFNITLKNMRELREDTSINKTFNILLNEDTDFTISFNIE